MTIALPMHRAISTKLAGRSYNVVTRLGYNPWLARVNHRSSDSDDNSSSCQSKANSIQAIYTRTYATSAAPKPLGRPKAHTGRAPAKRTRAPAAKKPGPKTAAGKAKVGRKPAAKTAAKTKAKPKAKPKPKARTVKAKRPPSKSAIALEKRRKKTTLRTTALLDEPKKLPQTPWTIIFAEAHKSGQFDLAGTHTKAAAEKLRNLSPEEKEHYNHVATQNKEKNEKAFKQWLGKFKPEEIREANNARRALRADHKASHPKLKSTQKYPILADDRLVKRPVVAYIQFSKERYASGDFRNMSGRESSALIAREWKALSAAEKKPYQDTQDADIRRYVEEHKSVYGTDPKSSKLIKK